MSQTTVLPYELLYMIMEFLDDDSSALCACALTAKALAACAQAILYRHVTLLGLSYGIGTKYARPRLIRSIAANPSLGALVKSLRMSGSVPSRLPSHPHGRGEGGGETVIRPGTLPFHQLSQLLVLDLRFVVFAQIDNLLDILAMLPKLERLVCSHIGTDEESEHLPMPVSDVMNHSQELAQFPKLKTFIVKNLASVVYRALADRLLLPRYRVMIAELQVVDISLIYDALPSDALAWVSTIDIARARLRSLSIFVADPESSGQPATANQYRTSSYSILLWPITHHFWCYTASHHTHVLDNIARFHALQLLCLKHRLDCRAFINRAHPRPNLLGALCDVLSRHPPPFPDLEGLELWMVDRAGDMVSVTPAVCTHLASILLDKLRYPRFHRLALHVKPEGWDPSHGGHWTALYEWRGTHREATDERWRTAFAAFGRAPGVVLAIDVPHLSYVL